MGDAVVGLLASRPRPTGYAVGSSGFGITVLCRLLGAGIRAPNEAGIIAMWDNEALDVTQPTIARYRADGELMGLRTGKMIL